MKRSWQKNPIIWIILLVGGGFLLGMTMTNRINRSEASHDPVWQIVPESIELRKTLDDVVIEEQIIIPENEIIVRPGRIIPPVRPVRPSPPNLVFTSDGPHFNLIVHSILPNLLAVGLILLGVWLIVRQNRKEKGPDPS